jgi:hypothetical protein
MWWFRIAAAARVAHVHGVFSEHGSGTS